MSKVHPRLAFVSLHQETASLTSFSICSHVVAAAEVNGRLNHFIEWYRKAMKMPSLAKLVTSDMPKGRGRKGGCVPRKKQTKTLVTIRVNLIDINSAANETTTPDSNHNICEPIPRTP